MWLKLLVWLTWITYCEHAGNSTQGVAISTHELDLNTVNSLVADSHSLSLSVHPPKSEDVATLLLSIWWFSATLHAADAMS